MDDGNFAVFAGREKLVYDTILLGRDLFHINTQVRLVVVVVVGGAAA